MSVSGEVWHPYEDSEDPLIFHDADVVLHMNVMARALFRVEHPRYEGMPLLRLIDPELYELAALRMKYLKENPNGELWDIEYVFYRDDGSSFLARAETRWMIPGEVAKSRLYQIRYWNR